MAGTLKRICGEMDVKPTHPDTGLTLTLRVTAYNNGMIEADGVPINAAPAYDPEHGWLSAAETALPTLRGGCPACRRPTRQTRQDQSAVGSQTRTVPVVLLSRR